MLTRFKKREVRFIGLFDNTIFAQEYFFTRRGAEYVSGFHNRMGTRYYTEVIRRDT